jgi:hypothetical protein
MPMRAVSARAMGLGFAGGVLLGVAVWTSIAVLTPARSQEPPRDQLTGEALAESLGLTLLPEKPSDCDYYVEAAAEPAGYCLEALPGSYEEKWAIGKRLQGEMPSHLDRQIFQLGYEISKLLMPDDRDRIEDLGSQLQALLDQQAQQGSG